MAALPQLSLGEFGIWFVGKAAVSLKEELLMRGLMLSGLVLVLDGRRTLAILVSALAFACIHLSNPGATSMSILGNTLGGVIYGVAFLQQVHDLGPAWLTGGSYGPEAGLVGILFRFVVIALILLWLRSAWRQGAVRGAPAGIVQG